MELRIRLDENNPLHADLIDLIKLYQRPGRASPVPDILRTFLLDGYRLYMGQIASGSQNQTNQANGAGGAIDLGDGRTVDPASRQRQRDQMRQALATLPGADLDL